MQSGKLRHKITFQSLIEGTNENGFPSKDCTDVISTWCAISPLRGKEFTKAQTDQHAVDIKINCRYISAITPDMRIKYGDHYFNIKSVINVDERNRELEIMATERSDDHG